MRSENHWHSAVDWYRHSIRSRGENRAGLDPLSAQRISFGFSDRVLYGVYVRRYPASAFSLP